MSFNFLETGFTYFRLPESHPWIRMLDPLHEYMICAAADQSALEDDFNEWDGHGAVGTAQPWKTFQVELDHDVILSPGFALQNPFMSDIQNYAKASRKLTGVLLSRVLEKGLLAKPEVAREGLSRGDSHFTFSHVSASETESAFVPWHLDDDVAITTMINGSRGQLLAMVGGKEIVVPPNCVAALAGTPLTEATDGAVPSAFHCIEVSAGETRTTPISFLSPDNIELVLSQAEAVTDLVSQQR